MSPGNSQRLSKELIFIFRHRLFPVPPQYYHEQGLKLIGEGEWKAALCPFHDDTKPSLRIRLEKGAFRYMGRGVHGGDVLAYHMQRQRLHFLEALKEHGVREKTL